MLIFLIQLKKLPLEFYNLISTIFLGAIGFVFSFYQHKIARKKRKDELFNLRNEFYNQISNIWLATNDKDNPTLDITDLFTLSTKAEFLFGKDISNHILSLEDKRADNGLFTEDDFNNPFYKYLKL